VAEDNPETATRAGSRLIGAPPRAIFLFAARTLGWGVVLFALWYAAAKPLSLTTTWIAARLLDMTAPIAGIRTAWEEKGVALEVRPDATAIYRAGVPAGSVYDTDVNPLKQTYGIPFFLALLAAGRAKRIAFKAVTGSGLLLALAAAGVACEVMVALGPLRGPTGIPIFAPGPMGSAMVALGFQLGTLIFPTVAPIAVWLWFEEPGAQGKIAGK
jgi:hypothetical protein